MRVILDTNIWLDLFVFDDPRTRMLGALIEAGSLNASASAPMIDELAAVLAYEHLSARCADPLELLARVRALCTPIETPAHAALPRCRDPHDQKFLDAAAATDARLLVSKDKALLRLARRIEAFAILAPGPALDRWLLAHANS